MLTSISSSYQQVQSLTFHLDEVAKVLSNLKNSGNCGSSFLLTLEEFLSKVIPKMMEKTNKILKKLEEMDSVEQNVKLEEEEEIDFSELSLNYGVEFWEGANNLDTSVKEEIDPEEGDFDPLEILPENDNERPSNQQDFLSIASNLIQNKIPVLVKRNRKKVIKPKSTPNATVSKETKKAENETNTSKQLIVSLTRLSKNEISKYKIPEGGGKNNEIIKGRPKRKRKTVKIAKKNKFLDYESEASKNSEGDESEYVPSEDEDVPKKRKTGKLPLTPEKEAEIIEHDKNVMNTIKNLKIGRPFTCPICQKVAKKPTPLIVHMHSHLKGLNAQCSICNRRFKHKYLLDSHMGKEHGEEVSKTKLKDNESYFKKFKEEDYTNPNLNEPYPFRCPICHKPCKTRFQAISHVETHSTEYKYLCSECGKSFTRQDAFSRHVQWWHSQQGKLYNCPTCKKEFDTIKKFRAHLELAHRSLEVDKQVYDEAKLLETLGIAPSEGRKYRRFSKPKVRRVHICSICNKRFLEKKLLEGHMHHHDPSIKFDCKFPGCGKSFGSKIRLSSHSRNHTHKQPKIYNCKQCSATFKWISSLRRHVNNTHPKEIVNWLFCPKCPDLKFKGQNVLTCHLNNAHYGKSNNNFKCDVNECQMHFENEEEMQVHKETSHPGQNRSNLFQFL